MRRIKMVGFWKEDLEQLIAHLEATNYNQEELARLKGMLEDIDG